MQQIKLTELGEGTEEAVVSFWHFSKGDRINKDDDLVELSTDKATFNVPASSSGVLKRICCAEGAAVKVGDVLAELE